MNSCAATRPRAATTLSLSVCIIEFCAIADAGVVCPERPADGTPLYDLDAAFGPRWATYVVTARLGSQPKTACEHLPQELPCPN